MPVLKEPEQFEEIQLPPRKARLGGEADVLVVGGGPAGMGAAVGAARAGARVILAEQYGFLGGHATVALVNPLASFYTHGGPLHAPVTSLLFPRDHGSGRPVVGGVFKEFLDILQSKSGCIPPSLTTGYTVPFDPEIYKLAVMDLMDRAGVVVLLHAFASNLFASKDKNSVVFETKSGPIVIKAKIICDCTGDGDLAAAAGAQYALGRDDGLTQPATLIFRLGKFAAEPFRKYVSEHPDDWNGVRGLHRIIDQVYHGREDEFPRENLLFFGTPHAEEVIVNSTRIHEVHGMNVFDLTFAEWEGHRQMEKITAFMKEHVPGFAESYIIQSGMIVGIRETRRIMGTYTLTEEDILAARRFDDVIARSSYPIDIHNPEGKGTYIRDVPADQAYDIPLRSLLPKGLDYLVMAGRSISGTHVAHSSYRIMPIAVATGHAAGVCAALAAGEDLSVHSVPVKKVQDELLRQGAILDLPVK
jgi:hypothetical protein